MNPEADSDGDFVVEPLGETTLLLRFGARIDAALNARVHEVALTLAAAQLPGITDLVPAYAALALHYEPSQWSQGNGGSPWQHLATAVRAVLRTPPAHAAATSAIVEIPVCYGGDFGPDLDALAQHARVSIDEAIGLHVAAEYRVAMLGFAPGFPYLLGLGTALHMSRRASPRTRVPSGSVGIGGAQTGIYPTELPGGWQLIGRTPLVLFDAARAQPALLTPGDRVRFRAIDTREFDELAAARHA
ncbi:MAG: 5-oxoprolinase subunit PxpB [Rhodanobacteraceae bacterium]